MTSENPSRQTAIASGFAAESFTRGPANEMPSSASASTSPGERVMRPDYGCDIYRLIFSPNDDTTAGLAIYYVRRALERWEPRIQVIRIDAERSPEAAERLDVIIEYRVVATQQLQALPFSINLAGEETV